MSSNNGHYLPDYMPGDEQSLMDWLDNYYKQLPAYEGSFAIADADVKKQQGILSSLVKVRSCLTSIRDYQKGMTELKNQLFYGDIGLNIPVPAAANLSVTNSTLLGGLIRTIVKQNNEKIFPSPNYNDTVGKDLGLLPIVHPQPAPQDLVAQSNVTCDGTAINIFTVLPKPANSQAVYVDKHDGKGLLLATVSEHSHCSYNTGLPVNETVWTFKVALRVKEKEVGTAAYINLSVKGT